MTATVGVRITAEGKEAVREYERVRDAQGKFTKSTNEASAAASGMTKSGTEMTGVVKKLSDEFDGLGKKIGAGLGLAALGKLFTQGIDLAREYGKSVAELSTAMQDTSGLEKQAASARALAIEFGNSAKEQVNALYDITGAGFEGAKAMNTLTAANKLAIGGVTNVGVAADGLTSVLNAYGSGIVSATDAADVMFVGMRVGKTKIEELSHSLGQVAPIAANVGVSFEELVAGIAAVTTGGVETRVAVTQMRAVLASVLKPSDEAAKLAKQLGLEFNTAAIKAKGLSGFLQDVVDKTHGSQDAMAILFGQIESLGTVFALTGNQADTFSGALEQMKNRAGEAEKATAKMRDTADFAFKQLKANAEDALISLGQNTLNVLLPAMKALNQHFKEFTDALVLATKLLGIYLVAFGALPALGTALISVYEALTAAMAANSVAAELGMTALQTGTIASITQIGLLRLAVGGLAAFFAGWEIGKYLRENFVEARIVGIAFVDAMLVGWEKLKQYGAIAWEGIKAAAVGAMNVIREGLASIITTYANAAEKLDIFGLSGDAITSARGFADALKPTVSAADELSWSIDRINQTADENIAKIKENTGAMAEYEIAAEQAKNSNIDLSKVTNTLNGLLREQNAHVSKNATDAALTYATAMVGIQRQEMALASAGMLNAEAQDQLNLSRTAALDIYHKQIQVQGEAITLDKASKTAKDELATAEKAALDLLDSLAGELTPVAKAQAVFDKGTRELTKRMQDWAIAGGDVTKIIKLWQQGEAALDANLKKTNAEIRQRNALANGNKDIKEQIDRQVDALSGLSSAQIAYNDSATEAHKLYDQMIKDGAKVEEADKQLEERLKALIELTKNAEVLNIVEQFGTQSEYDRLIDNIKKVGVAIKEAHDPASIKVLQRAENELSDQFQQRNIGALQKGVASLQSFAREGTAAYEALALAQDGLALASAIAGIANQAGGDPYTAFARMAAMAAAMAAIGIRISGYTGGGTGEDSSAGAAARQAHQGTGSVLGDAEAKSESIANAAEITANATSQLVGINRSMLTALLSLQEALGAAGNQLARGAADAKFPGFSDARNVLDPGGKDPISSGLGRALFGGTRTAIDQGIIIAGGTLNDMLNQIVVGAYQTVHTSGGLFHSGHNRDNVVDVSAQFSTQFGLVIKSIADTVRAGATALGLLPADIEAAIANFQIEQIRISLKGLSAEDQQKELEAVFSQIFDNLAGSVVPFIGQFQQVGEGLGETLIRIATEVQVTQQAFSQLGFAIDETDPEKFAQIADGLIKASGGIDAFIEGMNAFTDAFAPESHKFAVMFDALTSALDQVGLVLPDTRDGMWELMQSLDATTAQGQEQIATLLRLAGVADQYYSSIDKLSEEAAKNAATFADAFGPQADKTAAQAAELSAAFGDVGLTLPTTRDGMWELMQSLDATTEAGKAQIDTLLRLADVSAEYYDSLDNSAEELRNAIKKASSTIDASGINGLTDFQKQMMGLQETSQSLVEAYNVLARAQGLEGASANTLAHVHSWVARQVAQAVSALRVQVQDQIAKLYGGVPTSLEAINSRIEELQNAAGNAVDSVGEVGGALDDTFQKWLDGLRGIQDFLDNLLLDNNLTTLTPRDQMLEAQRQFQETLALAQGGDADALNQLPQLAQQFLTLARSFYSSGDDYQHIFDNLQDELQGLFDLPNPGTQNGPPGSGGGQLLYPSAELEALYKARDEAQKAQDESMRAQLAVDLANNLRQLADALNVDTLALATTMGVNLEKLAADLGVNLDDLNAQSVEALINMATTLGVSLTELTGGLGLQLTDLGGGVAELAASVGISLENLTSSSVQQLAELAGSLGVHLSDLTTSLGIDLGSLSNSQSLLNQGLTQTILGLPERERAQLTPLLDAISTATTEADANIAIGNLQGAVKDLSPGLANLLAPYFSGVNYSTTAPDVLELITANGWLSQIHEALGDLKALWASGPPVGWNLPPHASGAYSIANTGPALLHQDEMVIDPTVARGLRKYGIGVNVAGSGSDAVVAELQALRNERALADKQHIQEMMNLQKQIGELEQRLNEGNNISRHASDKVT